MLLNWRDHSWLHLFRQDKVMCSNITMSVEGRRVREGVRKRGMGGKVEIMTKGEQCESIKESKILNKMRAEWKTKM